MFCIKLKYLIFENLYVFFFSNQAFAKIQPPFENISISKIPKTYKEISFEDFDGNIINLKNIKSKIYVLNFWATWCYPCRVEMPSLDKLQVKDDIFIFPINMEEKNLKNTDKFYNDLNIKNLNIYFDNGLKLVKVFALRGVPTTIILNNNKEMVARISGSIDFSDEKFINWLSKVK